LHVSMNAVMVRFGRPVWRQGRGRVCATWEGPNVCGSGMGWWDRMNCSSVQWEGVQCNPVCVVCGVCRCAGTGGVRGGAVRCVACGGGVSEMAVWW